VAHIFKHPTSGAKGILVFTHKEWRHFTVLKKLPSRPALRYLWKSGLWHRPAEFLGTWKLGQALDEIARHYVLGVHLGWIVPTIDVDERVAFVMASPDNLTQWKPLKSQRQIPLASRNFIPEFFTPDPAGQKFWDIINVSRASKFKRIDEFFRAIRKIYDQGHKFRVLLVVAAGDENSKTAYLDLEKDYYRLFNDEERNLFTLMRLGPKLSFPGLPQETLAFFYRSAKVFALFSEREGGPKVLSEALASGLSVVIHKNLVGPEYNALLPKANTYRFEDYEGAPDRLIEAVTGAPLSPLDLEKLRSEVWAPRTVEKLKNEFRKLFGDLGMTFEGELLNLDRLHLRLPAHTHDGIPWGRLGTNETADILTVGQFQKLRDHLQLSRGNR
jgi:glycosyltransferase involved in cell wall biosynthesis